MAELSVPTPNQYRALRACMVCSLVQLASQFRKQGCPNCESFLQLQGNDDAVQDCTSAVFEGLITLTDPKTSWVAKWQRLSEYVPGNYAVKVTGTLPDDLTSSMEDQGITYIPRDGTYNDKTDQ